MTRDRALPAAQGLYDPARERDACGVGFVARIGGERSHEIVHKGIEVLVALEHRGACGCDPETGDGARRPPGRASRCRSPAPTRRG